MISKLTTYPDVNQVLEYFTNEILRVLGKNVVGVYLSGSLSYDAFDDNSSDLDLTVIVHEPISPDELERIRNLHREMTGRFPIWAARMECSYTPKEMLPSILPPKKPRPWYWGGENVLFPEAPYGNEWIINQYLHFEHAIALAGPEFRELMGAVPISEVQKACVRDLFAEWEPKKNDPAWFKDSHYESYLILNLCRILYTVTCGKAGPTRAASAWARNEYGKEWGKVIQSAENWKYGMKLDLKESGLAFLDFVINEVEKTEIFQELKTEIEGIRRRPEKS